MKKSLLTLAAIFSMTAAFAGNGTAESPYTVQEIINLGDKYPGADTYVEGYIVGALPSGAGVGMNKTVFGVDATIANTNIVLADASAEDTPEFCIPIKLPSGAVRDALNLVTHPENLGHKVLLQGTGLKYFSVPGFQPSSYQWIGAAPVYVEPDPVGTQENPVSISEFLTYPANGAKTWLKGYIVGFVDGNALEAGARFGTTNAVNTNFLLAATPTETNVANCIPVGIKAGTIRDEISLQKNPEALGRYIAVYGTHEIYFSVAGLKNVAEYAWLEGGDVPPTPTSKSIYTGLQSTDTECDWEINVDAVFSEPVTYVWSWKTYNGASYLNGSANIDKIAYDAKAYAISPVLDFTDYRDLAVSFEHCAKFQTSLKDLCKFLVKEDGAADWTELTISSWPPAGAWTWSDSGKIDLSAFSGKKIQFAFLYESNTTQGADTWEIRNVNVTGTSGVAGIDADEAEAIFFDLQGARVANPTNGLYIKVQGKKATKVVIR